MSGTSWLVILVMYLQKITVVFRVSAHGCLNIICDFGPHGCLLITQEWVLAQDTAVCSSIDQNFGDEINIQATVFSRYWAYFAYKRI